MIDFGQSFSSLILQLVGGGGAVIRFLFGDVCVAWHGRLLFVMPWSPEGRCCGVEGGGYKVSRAIAMPFPPQGGQVQVDANVDGLRAILAALGGDGQAAAQRSLAKTASEFWLQDK